MAPRETPEEGGGSLFSGLLAPLRLPERALEALDALAAAAGELAPIRSEIKRVREQTEPLAEVLPALDRLHERMEPLEGLLPALERLHRQTEPLAELLPALERLEQRLGTRLESMHDVVVALEGDESHLNASVQELQHELRALHKTICALQDDVKSVTDRLPDASRGPLEKARDILSSGPAQEEKE